MSSDAAELTPAQKLKALRKIQSLLNQVEQPIARACGLTQDELEALANEDMIEVFFSKDEGPDLDRYHIARILPAGFSILSLAEPDPLRVEIVPPHKSVWRRIYNSTRSGLWDLIKVGAGAALGWYLKKYFP